MEVPLLPLIQSTCIAPTPQPYSTNDKLHPYVHNKPENLTTTYNDVEARRSQQHRLQLFLQSTPYRSLEIRAPRPRNNKSLSSRRWQGTTATTCRLDMCWICHVPPIIYPVLIDWEAAPQPRRNTSFSLCTATEDLFVFVLTLSRVDVHVDKRAEVFLLCLHRSVSCCI